MKTIAVEEHIELADVTRAWDGLDAAAQAESRPKSPGGEVSERLAEVGSRRMDAMDAGDVDVQVISLAPPGLQSLPADQAVGLQSQANTHIAELVKAFPDRLQGFATLAVPAPEAAASELERAVTQLGLHGAMIYGRVGERNLDDRINWPIFEAAAALGAPLYIHPQIPRPSVREAYYSGFGQEVDGAFATAGIGWHYEAGVQFLRLALGGVLDRFPDLSIILGHWGEVVLFYLDRVDTLTQIAQLPRTLNEYARDHLYVSAGGIYSQRYLQWSAEVLGTDRLLFATDYPYRAAPEGGARAFLEASGLSRPTRKRSPAEIGSSSSRASVGDAAPAPVT